MMRNKEILYSIIIPHFNIPLLLQRLVESVPQRDDIQIIVVDDNSDKDKKPKLVERKGLEIILLNASQSKGAGKARNVGLGKAKGKYIIFADSDDYFESSFWGIVDRELENNNADIVYFKDRAVDSDTLEPIGTRNKNNTYIDGCLSGKKNAEDTIRFFHIVPWGKIFRGDFLRQTKVQFDEVIASNDVMFSTKTGALANKIDVSKYTMYVVTERMSSLVHTDTRESLRCRFEVSIRQNLYLRSIGKQYYSFNLIRSIANSLNFGMFECLWYLKQMFLYKVNPFAFAGRFFKQ